MRASLACSLLLLAACAAASKAPWNKLSVTWSVVGLGAYLTNNAFYELPLTAAAAQQQKWVQARAEDYVSLWCMEDDPRVCTLYDLQGHIAGLQLSLPVADLEGVPYDWTQHSLFSADTVLGHDVASGRFYLVPQEVLQGGGRATAEVIGSGLWLRDGDSLTNVPLDATALPAQGWVKENCIPTMGRHYYYNVTKAMDCMDFEPFFILANDRDDGVHGLGFQSFGKRSKTNRDWEENVPSPAIKLTVPTAPQCLADWADTYGILSLHVYFIEAPYAFLC